MFTITPEMQASLAFLYKTQFEWGLLPATVIKGYCDSGLITKEQFKDCVGKDYEEV